MCSQDLSRIVTSNVSSASMTIIERTAGRGRGAGAPPAGGPPRGGPPPAGGRGPGAQQIDWDETVVAVGRGVEGFDLTPDGREIWAANAQDGTISVIDMATKKVTDTVAANVTGANRLKITPDGKQALVSSLGLPHLSVFDVATRKELYAAADRARCRRPRDSARRRPCLRGVHAGRLCGGDRSEIDDGGGENRRRQTARRTGVGCSPVTVVKSATAFRGDISS